ncbi:beta-lactamase/transpeptidase-like protein [Lojkania enalia]|uniref:Beta-lactamase/transpeptidase-like protein n=1 Tax=Lojkania enalia TaxID=147567 RepID=A0A9P4K6Y3_9PLEO|nr:beta-lactamase/transpeptidase-like protein [Didymosphaeria enalia]
MSDFKDFVDKFTDPKKSAVLAVVALVADSEGNEFLNVTSGRTSLDTNANPVSRTSIFRQASTTKLITALAALKLVQSGLLALDDPHLIKSRLPELYDLDVLVSPPASVGGVGDEWVYEKRERDITLRMLLTHSSGVGYDMFDPRLIAWRESRGEQPKSLFGPVEEAFGCPLLFQPGEGWIYGGSLDWVGLLIKRVTGMGLGEVYRREVFDPVGCDQGIYFPVIRGEEGEKREGGGEADVEVVMTVVRKGETLEEHEVFLPTDELGGGGLYASSENYLKILADLIAPEPKLLNKEMMDVLFSPQFAEGSMPLKGLRDGAPIFASMTGALTGSMDTSNINHSLGGLLITGDEESVGMTAGTITWGGAFGTLWFVNREKGVAGYYATSVFPPGDVKSVELTGKFVKEVWRRVGQSKK